MVHERFYRNGTFAGTRGFQRAGSRVKAVCRLKPRWDYDSVADRYLTGGRVHGKRTGRLFKFNDSASFAVWLENKGSDSLARWGALQAWRKVKAWGW